MIITRKALPRRTFLRGMGVAIGLPLMEAMSSGNAVRAQVASGPKAARTADVSVCARTASTWRTGTRPIPAISRELPRILKPLEPFKDDVLMLSNLTHNWARVLLDGPGDHGRCSANYLTGAHVLKTDKSIYVNGAMSMDQLIASRIGSETRLPSLEIGMEDPRQSGNCDSGYSCAYTNNLAWKSPTQPMPPILDPRMLFDRLFGASADLSPAEREQQCRIRTSILDFVRESTTALAKRSRPHRSAQAGGIPDSDSVDRSADRKGSERSDSGPAGHGEACGYSSRLRGALQVAHGHGDRRVSGGPDTRRHFPRDA